MINFGAVPANSVLPVFFSSYGRTNGESITLTGLAVSGIEIYKGTSMTQRASDAGYVLLDTDGTDVDGITGIHAFSIDTGDNTDVGFYTVGSFYTVVVSAVTVDSQTVNFLAATFRIVAAESSSGTPKADISHIAGSTVSTSSAQIGVNVVNAGGTAWGSGAITASSIATDAITAGKIAADAIGASELAADAVTEIQSGLATAASIAALNNLSAAQVNAEVVDALATDTYVEPTGVPAATDDLATKIGYLYMALRNQVTVTSAKKKFFNDGGTAEWEKDLTDDGTTYTETEGNAP